MECNLHLRGLRMFVDLSSKKGGKKKKELDDLMETLEGVTCNLLEGLIERF